ATFTAAGPGRGSRPPRHRSGRAARMRHGRDWHPTHGADLQGYGYQPQGGPRRGGGTVTYHAAATSERTESDLTNSQEPRTFREYLRVARRQAWIIAAVALIGVAAAAFFSARQQKLYSSSATVVVSGFDPSQPPEMFLQTQADIASTSPELAERVRKALHLRNRPGIDVTPKTNSALLTFSSTTSIPELSARIATEYAVQFKRFQQRLASADVRTARAFLVRPATTGSKVQPKTSRNIVLGFLFGLILGCGLAFLRDALDTRVRSTEEISESLG